MFCFVFILATIPFSFISPFFFVFSLGDGIIYKSCHLATPVVASTPTTIYSSMETTSPLATANTLSSHNPDPQHTTETALKYA
jgi:hypothetical protein